jgi:hypothetical protein
LARDLRHLSEPKGGKTDKRSLAGRGMRQISTYKTGNLRGLRTKTGVGIKTMAMVNKIAAVMLRPPKIRRRSHLLTAKRNDHVSNALETRKFDKGAVVGVKH